MLLDTHSLHVKEVLGGVIVVVVVDGVVVVGGGVFPAGGGLLAPLPLLPYGRQPLWPVVRSLTQ